MKKFIAKLLISVLFVCCLCCFFWACTDTPKGGAPSQSESGQTADNVGDSSDIGSEEPGTEYEGPEGIWTPPVKEEII